MADSERFEYKQKKKMLRADIEDTRQIYKKRCAKYKTLRQMIAQLDEIVEDTLAEQHALAEKRAECSAEIEQHLHSLNVLHAGHLADVRRAFVSAKRPYTQQNRISAAHAASEECEHEKQALRGQIDCAVAERNGYKETIRAKKAILADLAENRNFQQEKCAIVLDAMRQENCRLTELSDQLESVCEFLNMYR